MVKERVLNAEEIRWRAEDDARTLKRMAELEMDKSRRAEALKIIKEEQKQLNKVLGAKKKSTGTGTGKPKGKK